MRTTWIVLFAVASCYEGGANPGDYVGTGDGVGGMTGVDTGGAQDIGAAREIINAGGVPQGSLITVEGLLSEHDVPTTGAPCQSPLCIRPAVGIAPSLETGHLERWMHVGLTSGIDLDTWQRPPTDLVVAIDKSASMSIDITSTTEAVARLVGHMRADDRIAILAFDDSIHVLHELGPVADTAALQAQVRAIHADGSWDIDMALAAAYGRLGTPTEGRTRHVVVLSCGYPQIDAEGTNATSQTIQARGRDGIGITFVGVLLGWDPNLAALLGKTNGANYYYLGDTAHVEQVFDADADLIITPIAYDLDLQIALAEGWSVERMYGLPGNADGTPATHYDVATAFFSHRRGSIVARLAWAGGGSAPLDTAAATLTYRPEPALGLPDPGPETVAAAAGSPDADGTYYAGAGVHKATMLVNMAVQMIAACNDYNANDAAKARTEVADLLAYLMVEQMTLAAPDMDPEIALVQKLLANMGGG
jgi:Ca-activated chloride channel family protein